jgi:hypothetical protein
VTEEMKARMNSGLSVGLAGIVGAESTATPSTSTGFFCFRASISVLRQALWTASPEFASRDDRRTPATTMALARRLSESAVWPGLATGVARWLPAEAFHGERGYELFTQTPVPMKGWGMCGRSASWSG